jgi:3'(2'), 5'-bisphosphate nucleotidase
MEWDVAAGHAILQAAGGSVLAPDGANFKYGKFANGLRNGPFIARGREATP